MAKGRDRSAESGGMMKLSAQDLHTGGQVEDHDVESYLFGEEDQVIESMQMSASHFRKADLR